MTTRQTIESKRARLGWSYYKLAQASGVAEKTVSDYLQGKTDTGTEKADAMAAAMKGKRKV